MRCVRILTGPLADEANFHFVTATRGLKLKDEHIALSRAFVEKFPNSPFAEEVLNNLASAYIIDDQDDEADAVFREILNRYPAGRFTERAAWKAGWWAYRQGQFSDALQYFDRGAAQFPRSDYRPSWLYWSGRAAQQAGDIETGVARLRLAATDYHNSYYGRLAVKRLEGERGGTITPTLQRQPLPSPAIPTAGRIASLLSVGLNREAMSELQYAQRVWGDSPQLQATIAVTHNRLGNVRAGINAMKRAYPQYLAAGGETLPSEILKVIFPVDYWSLLQKYAKERNLDPYLVAALVAQESNFDPVVVSHANAYGLMQILPSTGRSYARKLGVKPFSTRRLTEAEVNVRLGTQIFADDDPQVRRRPLRARRLQRRRQPRASPGSARSRACRRTSSSTTSRSPRRRITSSASSVLRRTTGSYIVLSSDQDSKRQARLVVRRFGVRRDDAAGQAPQRRQPLAGLSRFRSAAGDQGRRLRGDPGRAESIRAAVRHQGVSRRHCRATFTHRYGVELVADEQVTVCCGSTEAMMASMLSCIDPGDEVIVFEPFYENYGPDAILAGAEPKYVRMREPDWRFDPDELTAAFIEPHARDRHQLAEQSDRQGVHARRAAADCRASASSWDVLAISDEIYERIVFGGHAARADGVDPGHGRSHDHDRRPVEDLQRDGLAHRLGDFSAAADRRHPQAARLPHRGGADAVSRRRRRGVVAAGQRSTRSSRTTTKPSAT